jgi:hypothetical protein
MSNIKIEDIAFTGIVDLSLETADDVIGGSGNKGYGYGRGNEGHGNKGYGYGYGNEDHGNKGYGYGYGNEGRRA